jgi:hypothetical protein
MNFDQGLALDLYLDLLKRSLTATLYEREPDHDAVDARKFVVAFAMHYIRGNAVTMLPHARLDNIRACVAAILRDEIPGDVIEAGVWRGGGSIFLKGCLAAMGGGGRTVWVADSFEGLPEPDPAQAREYEFFHSRLMQENYARMAAGLEEVQANFAAYGLLDDRVRFLKGWFCDTLPAAPIERLALLRLDGDYYESTMDTLTALYDRLSPGGFVIVDDYGEDLWTNCRAAVDAFRAERGIVDALIPVDSKCVYWRKG